MAMGFSRPRSGRGSTELASLCAELCWIYCLRGCFAGTLSCSAADGRLSPAVPLFHQFHSPRLLGEFAGTSCHRNAPPYPPLSRVRGLTPFSASLALTRSARVARSLPSRFANSPQKKYVFRKNSRLAVDCRNGLVSSRSDLVHGRSNLVDGRSDLADRRSDLVNHRSDQVDGCSDLTGGRSDLMGGRSDQLDRRSDLLHSRGDLVDGRSDLVDRRSDLVDRRSNLVDHRSNLVDGRGDLVDGHGDRMDRRNDLAGRFFREAVASARRIQSWAVFRSPLSHSSAFQSYLASSRAAQRCRCQTRPLVPRTFGERR